MAEPLAQAQALRGLAPEELQTQLGALRKQLWQDRIKSKEGALPQSHQFKRVRRQIARILTILQERHGQRT